MRGFTLLELLVAIALMTLISGALYSSLFVGFKAQRSGRESLEPVRTGSLALGLLEQDFEGALPPTGVLAGPFTGTPGGGLGDSGSLVFFSCANVPNPGDTACDIRKVELAVETPEGETQPVLLRRITTNLLAPDEPLVREQVLCRGVRQFTVRYYDGTLWQDNWDSTVLSNVLPVAVEVTLEFALEPAQPGGAARSYRVTRVYRIPCGLAAGSNV